MSRLTPEREVEVRERLAIADYGSASRVISCLVAEIDALRAGRDEAILGAYRAAAEHEPIMGDDSPHGDAWIQCSCGWSPDSSLTWTAHILALTHTPESGE